MNNRRIVSENRDEIERIDGTRIYRLVMFIDIADAVVLTRAQKDAIRDKIEKAMGDLFRREVAKAIRENSPS